MDDVALHLLKEKRLNQASLWTVRQALELACELLGVLAIDSAKLDARILLEHVLNISRMDLLFNPNQVLSLEQINQFLALLKRRLTFEPIAYITGHKEFYGHDFLVNEHCLIPRPDTECVVEQCLLLLKPQREAKVFDICTGSGAIGITLLIEHAGLTVIASDLSKHALAIASKNAQNLNVEARFLGRYGDLFAAFLPHERAHLIVSNPPYIGERDYQNLDSTVRDFEPAMALKAGDALGINFYQRLLKEAPAYLVDGGFLVLEIGYDQADLIKMFVNEEWRSVGLFKDLAGQPRCLVLKRA